MHFLCKCLIISSRIFAIIYAFFENKAICGHLNSFAWRTHTRINYIIRNARVREVKQIMQHFGIFMLKILYISNICSNFAAQN